MRLLQLFVSIAIVTFISSCASPSGYEGYMNRSYTVRGSFYQPLSVDKALHYNEIGEASWYNESKFFGLKRGNTSLGEKVQAWHITGAHKTLPLPCRVKITNLRNGKTLTMRLNDRGPFIPGRIIDVTPRAAKKLGFHDQGLTNVRVEVLSVGDGKYEKKAKRKNRFFFF